TAVANYAAYREGNLAWALGRFIVPVARLPEFEKVAEPLLADETLREPWRLSTLLGNDVEADMRVVEEFNCRHAASAATPVLVDVVEGKAGTVDAVAAVLDQVPGTLQAYVEIPIVSDPYVLIAEI